MKPKTTAEHGFWTRTLFFRLVLYILLGFVAWSLAQGHLRVQLEHSEMLGGEKPDVDLRKAAVCMLDVVGATGGADFLVDLWPNSEPVLAVHEKASRADLGRGGDKAEQAAQYWCPHKHGAPGAAHAAQPLAGALFKILVVVVLSILWFCTFLVANDVKRACSRWRNYYPPYNATPPRMLTKLFRGRSLAAYPRLLARLRSPKDVLARLCGKSTKPVFIILALIPALPFILSMYGSYEPAVFVMALVAIYVAAEHYGGLVDTEHELHTRTEELKSTMGTVLDADGLNAWRSEVYDLYGQAKWRIDAIIRTFDIDIEWWKCAGANDPWGQYEERCAAGSGRFTLLHVLGRCSAKVQFAVDMPLPEVQAQPGVHPGDAKFFENLLGLAWYLVVFELAFDRRLKASERGSIEPPPYLRLKVTRAPSWMHVIDKETVYQLIERPSAGSSTVRQLTYNMTDAAAKRALGGWARDSVRGFARRGGRANEYVFSVLRYAALRSKPMGDSQDSELRGILNELGMSDFLKEPNESFRIVQSVASEQRKGGALLLTTDDVKILCVAVFQKLIDLRLREESRLVSVWARQPVTMQHLLSELL